MADPYYSVLIQLGETGPDTQSWTVTHTGDPHAADTLAPIAGLRFGCSMPDDILWPLQPTPMTAAFAINVPDFADLSWVGEDVPVAIEVKLHAAADVSFAFYGRITDAAATPRTGRPGVTLSCAAVDYTVDLTRGRYAGASLASAFEDSALATIWADNALLFGDFPTWPLPVGGLGHGTEINIASATGQTYEALVTPILAQAIHPDVSAPGYGRGTDGALVILAPNIDPATRLLDSDQPWTFDLAFQHPHTGHTIEAALLDRSSVTFGRNKRSRVDSITVYTSGGLGAPQSLTSGSLQLVTTTDLRTVSNDLTRVNQIGVFYLAGDAVEPRGWNITSLRYLLDQVDPAEFASDFPLDLMPRWTQAPGADTRAACYGTVLELDGIVDDTNPYSADPGGLFGLMSGADFSISGGRPSLTLQFRHLQGQEAPLPGAYGTSGYATAPYGALAPV